MNTIKEILDQLTQSKDTDEGISMSLRLDFAELILRNLALKKDWTQARLAKEAGLKESYISRIIHSDANFQASTVGKILNALGVRATLIEKPVSSVSSKEGTSDVEEKYIEEETISEGRYRFENYAEGITRVTNVDTSSAQPINIYSMG